MGKVCKTTIKIIPFLLILLLIIVFVNSFLINNRLYSFKKEVKTKFLYVKNINFTSETPISINININLNKKINRKKADEIFLYVKKFILKEETFDYLKQCHKKRYKYSFGRIYIQLFYKEDELAIKYFSAQDVDGEPSYRNFNTWYVEVNNGPSKRYSFKR